MPGRGTPASHKAHLKDVRPKVILALCPALRLSRGNEWSDAAGRNIPDHRIPHLMRKLLLVGVVLFGFVGWRFSQSLGDASSQNAGSNGESTDCSDPSMAGSAECIGTPATRPDSGQRNNAAPPISTPVLSNPGGVSPDQYTPSAPPPNPSQAPHAQAPIRPQTEFEQMVADSVGRPLPLFGQSPSSDA